VLSAITGLRVAQPDIPQPTIIGISIAVLVVLFSVQRYGTGKVSAVFAPVITVWLLFNSAIGIYNMTLYGWGTWQVGRRRRRPGGGRGGGADPSDLGPPSSPKPTSHPS
jgi:hypothetical protein